MHSTIHAACGQHKGQNELKAMCDWYLKKIVFFSQKGRASFRLFKMARASPKKGALQKRPRQNTAGESILDNDMLHQ